MDTVEALQWMANNHAECEWTTRSDIDPTGVVKVIWPTKWPWQRLSDWQESGYFESLLEAIQDAYHIQRNGTTYEQL